MKITKYHYITLKIFRQLLSCVFLLCIFSCNKLYSQGTRKVSGRDLMISIVEKNILIFRIKNKTDFSNIEGELTNQVNPRFIDLLPDNGCRLKLTYQKIDSLSYPVPGYKIYSIKNENYTYDCGEFEIVKHSYDYYDPYSKLFLIAFNNDSNTLKFISGAFYKSMIANDFDLIEDNPQTFLEYLKFRAYYLSVNSIQFVKSSKNSLVFTGYSQALNRPVNIKVDRKHFDSVQIN